jgi:hypothetical protein
MGEVVGRLVGGRVGAIGDFVGTETAGDAVGRRILSSFGKYRSQKS